MVWGLACSQPAERTPKAPSSQDTAPPAIDEPPAPEEVCVVDGPARSPMRRLTPAELDRTLTDLLGVTDAPAARILPPEATGGFGNNVDVRTVGADTVDAYSRLALEVASGVTADPTAVLTCPDLFDDLEYVLEAEEGWGEEVVYYEDSIVLFSAGYLETTVTLDHDGEYAVEARLRGTSCDGEAAQWNLWIDGEAVAEGDAPEAWSWVGGEYPLSAGDHTLRIVFPTTATCPSWAKTATCTSTACGSRATPSRWAPTRPSRRAHASGSRRFSSGPGAIRSTTRPTSSAS